MKATPWTSNRPYSLAFGKSNAIPMIDEIIIILSFGKYAGVVIPRWIFY
jgi:hypothetical protein